MKHSLPFIRLHLKTITSSHLMASQTMEHRKFEDKASYKNSRPHLRIKQDDTRGRTRSRSRGQQVQHRSCSYSRRPPSRPHSASERLGANTYRPSSSTQLFRASPKQKRDGISSDITLPKNFEKPLTCFFWHANGRCNKRDEDCIYAHWETGFFAMAPINASSSVPNEGTASQKVQKHALSNSKLFTDLNDREESLEIREEELNIKLEAVVRREKELEKLLRLREKEFRIREKRVVRNEEALKKANSVPWTCERCYRGKDR